MSIAKLNEMERLEQLAKCGGDKRKEEMFGMMYTKHTDKTERGLIKAIEAWFKFKGGICRRIHTQGRFLQGKKVGTGMYGLKQLPGKFIPTTGTLGAADLSILKDKIAWELEIKIGTDRQSTKQKEYQKNVESQGAIYTICHNFDEFIEQYNEIFGGDKC